MVLELLQFQEIDQQVDYLLPLFHRKYHIFIISLTKKPLSSLHTLYFFLLIFDNFFTINFTYNLNQIFKLFFWPSTPIKSFFYNFFFEQRLQTTDPPFYFTLKFSCVSLLFHFFVCFFFVNF